MGNSEGSGGGSAQPSAQVRAAAALIQRLAVERLNARASRDPALDCATSLLSSTEAGHAIVSAALTPALAEVWGQPHSLTLLDRADIERRLGRVAELAEANLRRELARRAGTCVHLDQVTFAALLFDNTGWTLDAIRDAVARASYDEATVRALARLGRGEDLPVEVVCKILPNVERPDVLLALIGRASGDVPGALAALLESDAFPNDTAGIRRRTFALFALCHLRVGDRYQATLRRSLRRVLRIEPDIAIVGLLLYLMGAIADPDLQEPTGELNSAFAVEIGVTFGELAAQPLHTTSIAELAAGLPDRVAEPPVPGAPTAPVRKIGRNDTCPCGSGKKFKQCCEPVPAAQRAWPSAPTRASILREVAPRLNPASIDRMPAADLASLNLTALKDVSLVAWFHRQLHLRDWSRSTRAIDEIASRATLNSELAELRGDLVRAALGARRFDLATEQLSVLTASGNEHADAVALAIATDAPTAIAQLRRAAHEALVDATGESMVGLAKTILRVDPALGVIFARAALDPRRPSDNAALLDVIEDARNELLLHPDDVASRREVNAATVEKTARAEHQMTASLEPLLRKFEATNSRLIDLERRNAARAAELAAAQQHVSSAESGGSDPALVSTLRSKIATLEAQIRTGNAERAELRRQRLDLGGQANVKAMQPAADAEHDDPDAHLESYESTPGRALLVPRFTREAEDSLGAAPRSIAKQALHTAADLAAGEAAAWRGVKQAKGMQTPLLSARIGIHYRLLFRFERGVLNVLELVPRGGLLTALKSYRSR